MKYSRVITTGFKESHVLLEEALKQIGINGGTDGSGDSGSETPAAAPSIITIDESLDLNTPPENPTLVYDPADGSYAVWRTDGSFDYIDMQAERVVKVGVDDLGSEHSYDLNPGIYYIFLNNIKDSLKLLPLSFSGDTHTAEIKGRFTAIIESNLSFQLVLPAFIHIPDKYLTNNSLILENNHTYEFNIMGNIFMLTDVTSATLSDSASSGNEDPLTPTDPPTPGGGKINR